jgi:cytochrome P450
MTTHWFSDVKAFRLDPLTLLTERAAQSDKPFVPLYLGTAPVVFVNDPACIKPLMKQSEDVLYKGRLVKKISAVVGESSLTLSGEEHRKRRAILHERLSRGVANTYVNEMGTAITTVAARLGRESTFRADILGGTLALKLACVALFGSQVLSTNDELAIMNAFVTLEGDLQASMFRFLPRMPWTYFRDKHLKDQALYTMDFVIRRVADAASKSSVLVALKEAGLTDEEIRNELTTMIIAGFHTKGAAVAWILHYMSQRPMEVQRIRAEYKSIANEEGSIDPAKVNDAKLSLSFVKEVLRLYPSAWWLTRELRQDFEIGGDKLKRGTTLIISPWVYHRSPKYFERPDEFSLDREHSGSAYLPFGAGARACVGMGVSLLELHLITLEFATAFDFSQLTSPTMLSPRPGITLNAPEMSMAVKVRGSPGSSMQEAA